MAVALLLPGLVFEAAYRLDGDMLRRTFGSVALLAVPGVLITGAVVAVVLTLATGLPIEQAFVVGAIVVGDRPGRGGEHDAPVWPPRLASSPWWTPRACSTTAPRPSCSSSPWLRSGPPRRRWPTT